MKTGKLLLASFLVISLTKGGIKDYGTTGNPMFLIFGIIVGLGLGFLLVRNAFKEKPIGYQPNKIAKGIWTIVSIISVFGILGVIFNLNPQTPKNVVEINGIKIPLDQCIYQTNRKTKNKEKSIEYCNCLASKLANYEDIAKYERKELEQGRFDLIINKYAKSPKIQELGIEECMSPEIAQEFIPKEWTENMKNSIRKGLMINIKGTDFEHTNNASEYCDCIIDSLVNYPIENIVSGEIYETKNYRLIDSICQQNSLK